MLTGFRVTFVLPLNPSFITYAEADFSTHSLKTQAYGLFGSLEQISDWINVYADDLYEFGERHFGNSTMLRHTDIGLRADEIQVDSKSELAERTASLRTQQSLLVDVDAFCMVKAINADPVALFQARTAVVKDVHSIAYSLVADETCKPGFITQLSPELPNQDQQKPVLVPPPPTHG